MSNLCIWNKDKCKLYIPKHNLVYPKIDNKERYIDTLAEDIIRNNIKKIDTYPSFCREARDKEGNLTFQNINENLKEIENLDILDLELNEIKKLSEYKNLFSQNWKKYLEY